MARTSSAAVILVLGDNYDTLNTPDLSPFIELAGALVDDLLTEDDDSLIDATRAELIERWLAAAFYDVRDQFYASKSTGGASGQFQGQFGMVLLSTKYGAYACAVDRTGYLMRLSKGIEEGGRRRVQIVSLAEEDE